MRRSVRATAVAVAVASPTFLFAPAAGAAPAPGWSADQLIGSATTDAYAQAKVTSNANGAAVATYVYRTGSSDNPVNRPSVVVRYAGQKWSAPYHLPLAARTDGAVAYAAIARYGRVVVVWDERNGDDFSHRVYWSQVYPGGEWSGKKQLLSLGTPSSDELGGFAMSPDGVGTLGYTRAGKPYVLHLSPKAQWSAPIAMPTRDGQAVDVSVRDNGWSTVGWEGSSGNDGCSGQHWTDLKPDGHPYGTLHDGPTTCDSGSDGSVDAVVPAQMVTSASGDGTAYVYATPTEQTGPMGPGYINDAYVSWKTPDGAWHTKDLAGDGDFRTSLSTAMDGPRVVAVFGESGGSDGPVLRMFDTLTGKITDLAPKTPAAYTCVALATKQRIVSWVVAAQGGPSTIRLETSAGGRVTTEDFATLSRYGCGIDAAGARVAFVRIGSGLTGSGRQVFARTR